MKTEKSFFKKSSQLNKLPILLMFVLFHTFLILVLSFMLTSYSTEEAESLTTVLVP